MCDPITIMAIVSAVGSAATIATAETPEVPLPDAVAADALEDTGAEVLLGGAGTSDDDDLAKASTASTSVTGTSGLSTIGQGTGISIL